MQLQKLFLVGSLVTFLGCSDTVSPGDLAISVTLNRSAMRVGDTLSVSVTVMNMGDRAYTLTNGSCLPPLQVYAPGGDLVPEDEVICGGTGMSRRLERGDSHTFQVIWTAETKRYDGTKIVRTPLEPGQYGFRGKVEIAELGEAVAGGAQIYVGP